LVAEGADLNDLVEPLLCKRAAGEQVTGGKRQHCDRSLHFPSECCFVFKQKQQGGHYARHSTLRL